MVFSLKGRISSPLEAGTSIVDGHHLPPSLNPALEYTSKRLARKALHLTCIVVKRDYQLPSPTLSSSGASAFSSPGSPAHSASVSSTSTPAWAAFGSASTNAGRFFDKPPTHSRTQSLDLTRNGLSSPTFSETSMHSAATVSTPSTTATADSTFTSTRARWGLASDPSSSVPMTPMTPFTVASSIAGTTDTGSVVSGAFPEPSQQFGMKLLHTAPPTAREDRSLKNSLEKAAKKFKIGPDWLSQPISPSYCGLTADLIDRSLQQNEVLFTSDGLTLLALDRLYTFKCAIQSYSKTQSPCRMEDAVDELRRLVLGNNMRKLRKSTLIHNYTWLGAVDDKALKDVCHMYHRAYGSHQQDNGIDNDMDTQSWPLPDTGLSLHTRPVMEDQETAALSKREGHFFLEELLNESSHEMGLEAQLSSELNEERGRQRVRSITPKQRSPLHSNASWSSGTPNRRKSPPAALHLSSPSPPRSQTPPRSGIQTPCSTYTEQSDTAPSIVSSLTTRSERAATPLSDEWAEEKEFLGMELQLDMDEIEDWYREVNINLDTVSFKPARAAIYLSEPPPEVQELRSASPSKTPLPPAQPQAPASAKVGLFGLRLDTSFQKPSRRAAPRGHQVSVSMDAAIAGTGPGFGTGNMDLAIRLDDLDIGGEDTEEELTARPPDSANPATEGLRGFKRWNSISIDSVLSPVEGPGVRDDERLGPQTPNGYEDISPVTRGEWGFLMGGDWNNGRQVNITKCL